MRIYGNEKVFCYFVVLLFKMYLLSYLLLPVSVNSHIDLIHSYSCTHALTNTNIHACKCGLAANTCAAWGQRDGGYLVLNHVS